MRCRCRAVLRRCGPERALAVDEILAAGVADADRLDDPARLQAHALDLRAPAGGDPERGRARCERPDPVRVLDARECRAGPRVELEERVRGTHAGDEHDPDRVLGRRDAARGLRRGDRAALRAAGARIEAGETLSVATQAQLRRADIVVLNKVDLAGQRVASATQRTLAKLAPSARFLWSHGGQVASSVLIGPATGHVAANETSVVAEWRADYEPISARDGRSRLGERCRTWCLVSEQPLEARAFRGWVARLPGTVMRGTGVVHLREEPQHRQEFALIGSRWRLTRGAPWGTTAPTTRVTLVSLGGEIRRARGATIVEESAPPLVRRRIQLQESPIAASEGEYR